MRVLVKSGVLAALLLVSGAAAAGCASGTVVEEDTGTPLRPDAGRDGATVPVDAAGDAATVACSLDADCDDRDACNGAETCVAGACAVGTPVSCADSAPCTIDTCDVGTGACTNTPDDLQCAAGLVCDRVDGCITARPCESDGDCDDGAFCNGTERCDLAFGCRRGAAPTCDDGQACTTDSCDASADACLNTADDMRCDDGLACNGAELCAPSDPAADGEGCAAGAPVVCDDGVPCTTDACDETTGGCASTPDPTSCDDGVFCNGAELCDPAMGGCVDGPIPPCDDTVGCSIGVCDLATDRCIQTANDAACSDGQLCNGTERCDPTGTTPGSGCVSGAAIDCSDGSTCTTDSCDEPGMCVHGGSDADGDGFQVRGCASGDDCDDLSARVNPSAMEICDGIDNDCSGTGIGTSGIDDGPGMECRLGSPERACTTTCGTAGTQPCEGTCRLGACHATAETCNGCDDDGDGLIDEPGGGSAVQCRSGESRTCIVPGCGTSGTQTCNSGCDWNRCVATEVCNSCDDDGDGAIDNGFTLGGMCTVGVGECRRTGANVCRSDGTGSVCSATPGAPVAERCNGLDDNCAGGIDETFTELGTACTAGVGACRQTGVFICRTDGSSTTCSVSGGAPVAETCNGIDDNCNMMIDDGADGGACDGMDGDSCLEGTNRCVSGMLRCDDMTTTNVEACNMLDDNCDGTVDEGCACTLGSTASCYGGPAGTAGVGLCRSGTQTCVVGTGGVGSMWGACMGAVLPVTEICNGMDDDCVMGADNGNPGGGAPCDGIDADLCNEGTATCTGGMVVCNDPNDVDVETCNAVDDNCNGSVDEGNPGGGAACDGGDGDSCNEGNLFCCTAGTPGCTVGMLACNDTTPTNVELCNGLDDNCNGTPDEGNPGGGAACDGTGDTDLCTDGTTVCTGSMIVCSDSTPNLVEICGNTADDDCNPATPDVCSVPGDTCASPIVLSGTGGSRMDTLVGATAQTTDCSTLGGVEIFYSITVATPTLVYLSTLGGAAFDTKISYRGTSCPGASSNCVDDSCASLQTHLVQSIGAGTHFFAVHTFSSGTTPGVVGLTYALYASGGGTNVLVSPTPAAGSTMAFSGSTSGANLLTPSCGSSSHTAPEATYYWTQCASETRSYSASMCGGSTWDSALSMRRNGTSFVCNDDFCGSFGASAFTAATTSGAGPVQLVVDGWSSASGSYTVNVTF